MSSMFDHLGEISTAGLNRLELGMFNRLFLTVSQYVHCLSTLVTS